VLGTLTYPDGDEWLDCKRHWRAFVEAIRRRHTRPDISIFWFLEFQANGRAHIHFFSNQRLPFRWVARTWYRIVDSGNSDHLAAGTRIEKLKRGRAGAVSYGKKYAQKQSQKKLPPVLLDSGLGRWWGVSGDRKCTTAGTRLSTRQMRSPAIERAWTELFDTLEGLLSAERVRVIDEGCGYCYWCVDDDTERILAAAINGVTRTASREN